MIWVRVSCDPVRQFYADPRALVFMDARQSRHALLAGVGVLRAGTDGEAANVDVVLRNDAAQATRLFAMPPVAAQVQILDDETLLFAGAIASIALDDNCTLRVEA